MWLLRVKEQVALLFAAGKLPWLAHLPSSCPQCHSVQESNLGDMARYVLLMRGTGNVMLACTPHHVHTEASCTKLTYLGKFNFT